MNHSILVLLLMVGFTGFSQRNLVPRKKGDAFGKRDFNNYKPYGIQFSIGPTYTMTRTDKPSRNTSEIINRPYILERNPVGKLGIFLDLGMAHFPMKPAYTSAGGKKFRILSYVDWGIGLQSYSGVENLRVDYLNGDNEVVLTEQSQAKWTNTYATGRLTLHKNNYIGKVIFIDNALGINFDYRLSTNDRPHSLSFQPLEQNDQGTSAFQVHYGLGVGFKLRRNVFLVPSVETPVLGLYEWKKGNPSVDWFSSYYWPIKFRVKIIRLFIQKGKGSCYQGTEDDQKKAREYQQNR